MYSALEWLKLVLALYQIYIVIVIYTFSDIWVLKTSVDKPHIFVNYSYFYIYLFIHYVVYCVIMHHNVCIEMQGLKSMNICRQPHIFVNYSYIYIYIYIYLFIHHNIMYA